MVIISVANGAEFAWNLRGAPYSPPSPLSFMRYSARNAEKELNKLIIRYLSRKLTKDRENILYKYLIRQ